MQSNLVSTENGAPAEVARLRRYGGQFALLGALGAAGDWLLDFSAPGLAFVLFALLLLAGAALAQGRARRCGLAGLVLAVGCLPFLAAPGVLAFGFGLAGLALAVVYLGPPEGAFWARGRQALALLAHVFWLIFPEMVRAIALLLQVRQGRWTPTALLIWVMPVLASLVFLLLLGAGNPLIAAALNMLPRFDWWQALPWGDIVCALLVAAFCCPFIIFPAARTQVKTDQRAAGAPAPHTVLALLAGPGAVVRALLCFNLLFAVQTAMDVYYLWFGAALPAGFTYADYAHRGAYPLIVTALLAGLFAVLASRPGSAVAASRRIKILLLAWVAQTIMLVMSALLRLGIYVQTYSLTELRLAAGLWMALVALGLVFIVLRVVRGLPVVWLCKANGVALAAVLFGWAVADVPAVVAMEDVTHCYEAAGHGAAFDESYVASLGPQAIPALDRYQQLILKTPSTVPFPQGGQAGDDRRRLADNFWNAPHGWRNWNFWDWTLQVYLGVHGAP